MPCLDGACCILGFLGAGAAVASSPPNVSSEIVGCAACVKVELRDIEITVPAGAVVQRTTLTGKVGDHNGIAPTFEIFFNDFSQPRKPVQLKVKTQVDLRTQSIHLMADNEKVNAPVYFRLGDPYTAYVETPHFSKFEFQVAPGAKITLDLDGVDESNRPSGQCRHASHFFHDYKGAKQTWSRGGEIYLVPYNCHRKAIECDEGKWIQSPADDTIVGYHGVPDPETARLIIKHGFKLPSQLRSEKGGKGICDGHIGLGMKVFGIDNWADAVFLSPTPKYSMSPAYAGKHTLRQMSNQPGRILTVSGSMDLDGNISVCFLQCRIKKAGLTINPKTGKNAFPDTSGLYGCDIRVSGEELEYRVADPRNVKVVGLCYRVFRGDAGELHRWCTDGSAI